MKKNIFEGNRRGNHFEIDNKPIKLPKPTMKSVQQAYSTDNKQVTSFNEEDLIYLNDWIQYRVFDSYLITLIVAINEQLDLPDDTKEAFLFNAERTTAPLYKLDEWVYLGSQLVEEIETIPFAEKIEMLKYPNHKKSINMKEQIVESRMIETLKAKQNEFYEMYKKVVEKAVLIVDLLESYDSSLEQLEVDGVNVEFDKILHTMQIEFLEIVAGDRLELEKCITIDVTETKDITKEFLIKKVVQKGITVKGELNRKASVVVYRWEEELDD